MGNSIQNGVYNFQSYMFSLFSFLSFAQEPQNLYLSFIYVVKRTFNKSMTNKTIYKKDFCFNNVKQLES